MKPRNTSYFNCGACKPFFHQGGEKGILFIHGFTGSVAHMRPLGDALHAYGYTAMGINLPGHASSEMEMAKVGYREWLLAALDAMETLKKHCRTVAVCGLSMGAVLSLLLAEQQKTDACVSISAPFPSSNRLLPFTGIMGFIIPRIAWKTDKKRKDQLDQRYDKNYTGFPTRKGGDLYHLIQQARKNLIQITCPTLVVQSMDDGAVDPSSADNILNGISSVQRRKLILHGAPHVCTISEKMPAIVNEIEILMETL